MEFKIRLQKEKEETVYKSLYMRQKQVDQINKIAKEYNTSFNNVVISMIESCLDETDEER
ncbi:hypothetical protein CLOSTMETH_00636 [[Clostridium] methylpentosum DSM 5476]|uniref:Uncharacterized protein n=1 Tax=[Clostridium] methylpentosum DSM 5476 TaxID=537013 RepID=C0E9Y4_9FIRM|nr:hypothetical protein CLOSTMETH_00636 [[Clostridium] methylpentosum DSM 5476]MDY3989276.1 hypothetical protein [Massilioclostridium sp.]MEE1492813.1 hypothetical protein [Massilioclostridium sp.]